MSVPDFTTTATTTVVDDVVSLLSLQLLKLKSLGVVVDGHLWFDSHAREIRASNYHTCAHRHICLTLSDDTARSIACSLVASKLDYCNSLLYGAPAATIDKFAESAKQPGEGGQPVPQTH